MEMKEPLFPIWQVDEQEYRAICAYLGLSPIPQLYEKLNDYLIHAPFRFQIPNNFSFYLAKPRLTRFRIARLDLTSKLLYPTHPIRHILNAVIALHECDGKGYFQMSAAPLGWALPFRLTIWGVQFIASVAITFIWLCWHRLLYLSGSALQMKGEGVTGKRILITGVNRGLGKDLLLIALQQGAKVIGTVRSMEAAEDLIQQLPAEAPIEFIAADLSQPGALTNALQNSRTTAETIDIAILCAGTKYSDASILSLSQLRETFEVNYFSNVDLARWLCRSGNQPTLVLVSSMGRWHGMHSSCGYNASKAALSIWAESLEMELNLQKKPLCKVLIVEPGIFISGMVEKRGIGRLLAISRQDLAAHIIASATSGRRVLRFPIWFALLTWAICMAGRGVRLRLFSHIKSTEGK